MFHETFQSCVCVCVSLACNVKCILTMDCEERSLKKTVLSDALVSY